LNGIAIFEELVKVVNLISEAFNSLELKILLKRVKKLIGNSCIKTNWVELNSIRIMFCDFFDLNSSFS
jgi:hypothetical protein